MEGKILGIDFGARRVGVAVADPSAKFATPLTTIKVDENLIAKINEISQEQGIRTIVLGLPRNLDGMDTPQTEIVRVFASRLAEAINLPIHLQDEALTSEIAMERLKSRHAGTIKKELVDSEAAAIILQDYLDSL